MRLMDKKAFKDFVMILQNIWHSHNNALFRGKEEEASLFWDRTKTLVDDFWIHNFTNKPIIPQTHSPQKLEKPPNEYIKINMDAAMADDKIGIGVIARDRDGFVLGGIASCKAEHMSAEWAELCALVEGINLVRTNNFEMVIFETDYASIVNRFRKNQEDVTIIVHRFKVIMYMLDSFSEVDVKWIERSRNKVADHLSRLALTKKCNLLFGMEYPSDIHHIVIFDSF